MWFRRSVSQPVAPVPVAAVMPPPTTLVRPEGTLASLVLTLSKDREVLGQLQGFDAKGRLLSGPWPVVAHHPHQKWSAQEFRLGKAQPLSQLARQELGDKALWLESPQGRVLLHGGAKPTSSIGFRLPDIALQDILQHNQAPGLTLSVQQASFKPRSVITPSINAGRWAASAASMAWTASVLVQKDTCAWTTSAWYQEMTEPTKMAEPEALDPVWTQERPEPQGFTGPEALAAAVIAPALMIEHEAVAPSVKREEEPEESYYDLMNRRAWLEKFHDTEDPAPAYNPYVPDPFCPNTDPYHRHDRDDPPKTASWSYDDER